MLKLLVVIAGLIVCYGLIAYMLLPSVWTHYEHQQGLAGLPMVTRTAQGIPADPLNVGLVGTKENVVRAMQASGWLPADPITLRTSLEIAGSVLLDHPYPNAPVSTLFYLGRREDLAFEKEVGPSANRRHHIRLWKTLDSGVEGRPVWLGSATFDRGSGLSRYTGQITHRIAPDVDTERDSLIRDLTRAGMVSQMYQVSGVGPTLNGHNGEGDRYFTDGEIHMAVLTADGSGAAPTVLETPTMVSLKDALWNRITQRLRN
jgi:hypothetical protein